MNDISGCGYAVLEVCIVARIVNYDAEEPKRMGKTRVII